MLIKFRVENHRSLRDEQTLSMVAAINGDADRDGLLHPTGLNEALLPVVALYGANASGKTNVLLALALMQDAVIESHRLWEPDGGVPVEPFALSKHQLEPSLYEVEMLVEGVRYRYGFVISAARVEEEWLFAWPGKRRQLRFERKGDEYDFGTGLGSNVNVIRELTRSNSLFLAAGAQNNNPALLRVFRWFQRLRIDLSTTVHSSRRNARLTDGLLRTIRGLSVQSQLALFGEGEVVQDADRAIFTTLLQSADTGILDLRFLPEDEGGASRQRRLYFRHKTEDADRAWLPLEVESAGTQRLLERSTWIIPVLRTGGVLCVDELETSLHPMLATALLRLFCDPAQNPNGAQLIFTTHDTNLLGNTLGGSVLRRDQVWLTEKDQSGATHLYPLTDFHPRKHENMERGYLQGRYGAVPFLGELLAAPDGVE